LGYHDGTNTTLFKDNISGLTNLSTTDGGLAPTGAQVNLLSYYHGQQIYKVGSPSSETNIGNGMIYFQPSTPRSIEFNVYVKFGSSVPVYSSASWTMNVIDF
jgi:hypothetical protein